MPLDALFHFAHAGQVFIELAFVARTDALGKILGAILDAVENAEVLQAATVVKQVVPGERWVHFYRDRRIRTLPGEVGTVGQGKVRLVVTGHGLLAGQHDARLRRLFAHAVGNHLIDADAGVDDGAFRNVRAGQQTAGLGGMNSLPRERLDVETINHVDLLFERLQGRQRLREFHGRALALGAPVIFVNAIAQEDDAKTLGEGGRWWHIR